MPHPIEKQVTSTIYVLPCNVCGKDGTVSKSAIDFRCYTCIMQERKKVAEEKQLFLIGATIIGFAMKDNEEFEMITVLTAEGHRFVFSHGGYDGDYYIEVEKEE